MAMSRPRPALPASSLQSVSPCLWHAMFPSSPTHSSLFLPSSKWGLICNVPRFPAHQPAPLIFSPSASESLFTMCHRSKLPNMLLPLPPLQLVSPCLWHVTFPSSSTCSSLFLPSSRWVLICDVPRFQTHEPAPPSSPPVGEPSFVTCYISKLMNLLLPLPPL